MDHLLGNLDGGDLRATSREKGGRKLEVG